ncbi:cytosine permease [Streptomyces atratus]|uniref:Cytosine permease n=1 Tax=Streptomyces atratus TaxID=1893 RepID=A0A1K2EZJ0_STRAR|nr:cytosine permease [Streptomyces atratus]
MRQVAFIAWAAGAAAGGLVHWFAPEFSDAVSGLAVALIVHVVIERAPARPAAAQTT